MDIALIGEGTYPYQFGGVSVWCDQLVRGMPAYDFKVVALVSTGIEPVRFELPDNVTSVSAVPLWGPVPPGPRPKRNAMASFRPLLVRLVDVLLSPSDEGQDAFAEVMRELFDYGQQDNLHAVLTSQDAVAVLSDAWRQRAAGSGQAAPTLHDAVAAIQILEHSLRPLSHTPVQADIAHAVTNGLGALPALASKWTFDTPVLITEHAVALREQYLYMQHRQAMFGWPAKAFYLAFLQRLCTLGYQEAATIAPGNIYNTRWEERLGADATRVRTVYNGVEPEEFPAVAVEPDVPTIAWTGRIVPFKDLETLLRAFALVVREIPDARLRIFGWVPAGLESYLARCQALVAELGIGASVVFEGRVDEVRDAYAAGHIVVLCSVTEGFPYTLIEAMTCGRACVGTDVGGVAEALGDTGLVVPPRSPIALAQACLTLLRDKELRGRLGAAARLRALEHFTVDRAISAYDEIYTFLSTGHALPKESAVRPGGAGDTAGTADSADPTDSVEESDLADAPRTPAPVWAGPPHLSAPPIRWQSPKAAQRVVEKSRHLRAVAAVQNWRETQKAATVVVAMAQTMRMASATKHKADELIAAADKITRKARGIAQTMADAQGAADDTALVARTARREARAAAQAAGQAKTRAERTAQEASTAAQQARAAAQASVDARGRARAVEEIVESTGSADFSESWKEAWRRVRALEIPVVPVADAEPEAPVSMGAVR